MQIRKGKTIRSGFAVGKLHIIAAKPNVKKFSVTDVDTEVQRTRDAIATLVQIMDKKISVADQTTATILNGQKLLLEDTNFYNDIANRITRQKICAEFAVSESAKGLAQEMEHLQDKYLRTRAEDIRQVAGLLTDVLLGYNNVTELAEDVILVAEEFTPAQLIALDKAHILGLIAKSGSPASHTSILAENYGWPYIAGIDFSEFSNNTVVILDGDNECVIVEPNQETLQFAMTKITEQKTLDEQAPIATNMKVCANISSVEDMAKVIECNADGIGLFRTEFIFMNRTLPPDEDEQYAIYSQVLKEMQGKEVIIRTIDVGTDKPVPYLNMTAEENPALGLRGLRVSLANPEIFRVQLRALLRASLCGNLGVMFPMVTSLCEIGKIKKQINLAKTELNLRKEQYADFKLGAMIETPAAALIAEQLGKELDFLSIGTNDLTQYTLALDRQAHGLDEYYDAHHEAVLSLIEMTVKGAVKHHCPVGICGKLGGDKKIIPRLVQAGLAEVSVAPASISSVRQAIAKAENQMSVSVCCNNFVTGTNDTEEIAAPASGQLLNLKDVPDKTFASGVLGQGFAIDPDDGIIRSPIIGTITNIAEARHAVCITSPCGTEVLLHIGIDTINLKGNYFDVKVKENQRVQKGDVLIEADLAGIKAAGYSAITPVIICKTGEGRELEYIIKEVAPETAPIPNHTEKKVEITAAEAKSISGKPNFSLIHYVQNLGKAIMLPVAVLPVCGLLMGLGYMLCPATMQGGNIVGFSNVLGLSMVKAGSALIDNMAMMFAIGVGIGMSEKNNGTGALAALASWLMLTSLLSTNFITTIFPEIAKDQNIILAFSKIANPFIGILAGLIGANCFNRFKNAHMPDWLGFFSGKRFVPVAASVISIFVAAALFFIWPILFNGLVTLGKGIADMGAFGAGIYAFLNRLLIPLGLHHALNNVFWFDTIGLGDLTHYWAQHSSKDVTWSLGMYMSGFFPCMMFGVPGAALAIVHTVKDKTKHKLTAGLFLSAAICSFVSGVTEPFEFAFMFAAPILYFAYSLLYGIFTFIVTVVGFRAGFCFSAGAIDLAFSSFLPAAANTWMIIPLGIAAFICFYLVFRIMIQKLNLPTPGRETGFEEGIKSLENNMGDNKYNKQAELLLNALGGKDNVVSLDNCITRLRIKVKSGQAVNDSGIKKSGAINIIHINDTSLQIVIGTKAQFLADAIREKL